MAYFIDATFTGTKPPGKLNLLVPHLLVLNHQELNCKFTWWFSASKCGINKLSLPGGLVPLNVTSIN
jgi:hypothetical protein